MYNSNDRKNEESKIRNSSSINRESALTFGETEENAGFGKPKLIQFNNQQNIEERSEGTQYNEFLHPNMVEISEGFDQ